VLRKSYIFALVLLVLMISACSNGGSLSDKDRAAIMKYTQDIGQHVTDMNTVTNELRDILPHPQFTDKTWQEKIIKDTALLESYGKNAKLIDCPSQYKSAHVHYMAAMDIYIKTTKDINDLFSVIAAYDSTKKDELDKASKMVGQDWDDSDTELGKYADALQEENKILKLTN
jgi:hypothetical protein